MFILKIPVHPHSNELKVKLPRPNLQIDSRPNNLQNWRFKCTYNGSDMTATLVRIDDDPEWDSILELRVYDPAIETVPSFDSTIYTYMGLDGEKVPQDTTSAIIDPSVRSIKERAFFACKKLRQCIMYDGVETIEFRAFSDCIAMKVIKLSRNLKHIGYRAFYRCTSMDALFLPSSVGHIEDEAFAYCMSIRVLHISPHPNILRNGLLGKGVFNSCDTLLHCDTGIKQCNYCHDGYASNVIYQNMINFHHNLHPFHRTCLDINVTAKKIYDFVERYGAESAAITDHNGMTPLHILSINPHATIGSIVTCFHIYANAALIRDTRGKSPLDYLQEYDHVEAYTSLIEALCVYRNATLREYRNG